MQGPGLSPQHHKTKPETAILVYISRKSESGTVRGHLVTCDLLTCLVLGRAHTKVLAPHTVKLVAGHNKHFHQLENPSSSFWSNYG